MASSLKFSDKPSAVVDRYADQMKAISEHKYGDYDITYAHADMCQVYLPYSDKDLSLYEVTQGDVTMRVVSGRYLDPNTREERKYGIPCGTRARLLLYLINEQAILSREPSFQLATSFRDLCGKLRIPRSGRSMAELKIQLERLCTASFSLEWKNSQQHGLHNFFIVESIVTNGKFKNMDYSDVESKTKGFQITLSDKYFNSVINRGVPLDKRTITALQNNSMCLDIYSWLTHRLYRIPKGKTQFVPWQALKNQFGDGFDKMFNFKRDFRKNLQNVRLQYREARISEIHNKGFELHPSAPPIGEKLLL